MGVKFVDNSATAKNGILEQEKKALRATAKILKKAAKAEVPERSGALKQNIATWVKVNRRTGEVKLELGVYNTSRAKKKGLIPAGFRAHFTEFGTSKSRGKSFLKAPTLSNIEAIRKKQAEYLPEVVNLDNFQDIDEEVDD